MPLPRIGLGENLAGSRGPHEPQQLKRLQYYVVDAITPLSQHRLKLPLRSAQAERQCVGLKLSSYL